MDWIELSASVAAGQVEALCAALEGIVPGGCSIEDAIVPLGPEEGFRREPWRPSTVRVYLPVDTQGDGRRTAVLKALGSLPFPVHPIERAVREEDWANGWKEFFQVERIGTHLVIQPTWREFTPLPGDVVLHLDPGMAFGTGQHETTRMCLVAIEELMRSGIAVLDVGCGSGILAIAAAKLGADTVDAVDTESVAIEATVANARRNGVETIVRVAEGSLDERWPFAELPDSRFELAAVNIHAAASIALAPALHAALRPGGSIVASGIISERLPDVLDAFAAAGFMPPTVQAEGEWRAVVARRPDRSTSGGRV